MSASTKSSSSSRPTVAANPGTIEVRVTDLLCRYTRFYLREQIPDTIQIPCGRVSTVELVESLAQHARAKEAVDGPDFIEIHDLANRDKSGVAKHRSVTSALATISKSKVPPKLSKEQRQHEIGIEFITKVEEMGYVRIEAGEDGELVLREPYEELAVPPVQK